MSLLAKILKMDCRQVLEPQRSCVCGVIFVSMLHQLPKLSGSSPSLEVPSNTAATAEDKGEEEMVAASEGFLHPSPHPSHRRVKSLQEMPGPKTFSNLVEFFWKDGFSRIHEIQVQVSYHFGVGGGGEREGGGRVGGWLQDSWLPRYHQVGPLSSPQTSKSNKPWALALPPSVSGRGRIKTAPPPVPSPPPPVVGSWGIRGSSI